MKLIIFIFILIQVHGNSVAEMTGTTSGYMGESPMEDILDKSSDSLTVFEDGKVSLSKSNQKEKETTPGTLYSKKTNEKSQLDWPEKLKEKCKNVEKNRGCKFFKNNENNITNTINDLKQKTVLELKFSDNRPGCTGFLIGNNLVMTNNHCMNEDLCKKTNVSFDGVETKIKCVELIKGNKELDYAIFRLETKPSFGQSALLYNGNFKSVLTKDPQLFVIQYPDAKLKLSWIDCAFEYENDISTDYFFIHRCDTKKSSSGSPIYLYNGINSSVIGLHNSAYHLWNGAIKMENILLDIKENNETLYKSLRILK